MVIVALLVLLIGIVLVRCDGSGDSSEPSSQSGNPSTTPTATTTPGQPSDDPSQSTPVDQRKIVEVAATVANTLSTAAFQPTEELKRLAKQFVASEQRQAFIATTRQSATVLIAETGYQTAQDADLYSAYYVDVQKYRIEDVQEQSAVISLYVVTSWVTASKEQYLVPDILVIHLERSGSKWLYVRSTLGKEPPVQAGLTYDQTVSRFQPYLKGFKDYDTLDTAS
jgi:hypothetical protein